MIDIRHVEQRLKRLSWSVDRSGVWASIQTRAGVEPGAVGDGSGPSVEDRAPARARKLNRHIAVYASIGVVLVAGITVGSLEAVKHLGNDKPILVITDDTLSPTTTGGTTQTTAGGTAITGTATTETVTTGETPIRTSTGQWEWLPLTSAGGDMAESGLLVMDPGDPSVLYAAGGWDRGEGLFKSTDGAQTWKQLQLPMGFEGGGYEVTLDPTASPSAVYVYSHWWDADGDPVGKLMRSDDGGATWTDLTDGYPGGGILCDPTTVPATLYAYTPWFQYLFRSTDRGETWTDLTPPDFEDFDLEAQADYDDFYRAADAASLPPAAQQALDTLQAEHIEKRTKWGKDVLVDADTGALVEFFAEERVLVDPTDPSTFYAGTSEGVYKSSDGGRNWKKASRGLVNPAVMGVAVDPSKPSTFYAATPNGIFRSTDSGEKWTVILGGNGSVVVTPSDPARLYAWTTAGLFRSEDRGEAWTPLAGQGLPSSSESPGHMTQLLGRLLLAVAGQPDTLFAEFPDTSMGGITEERRVLCKSTDGGDTWVRCTPDAVLTPYVGLCRAVPDPQNPATVYLYDTDPGEPGPGGPYGWWLRSSDGGASWIDPAGKQNSGPPIWAVLGDLWVEGQVEDETVYTLEISFAHSLDGGATWQLESSGPIINGLGLETWDIPLTYGEASQDLRISVNQMLFDPQSRDTRYVIASVFGPAGIYEDDRPWNEGLYRSTDEGDTWEDLTGVLSSLGAVNDILVNPASGGTIYAATDSGLYRWVPDE